MEQTSDKPLTIPPGSFGLRDYVCIIVIIWWISTPYSYGQLPLRITDRPGPSSLALCKWQLKISPAQTLVPVAFRITFFASQIYGCLNVIFSLPLRLSHYPDRPRTLLCPSLILLLPSSSSHPSSSVDSIWPTGRMLPSRASGTSLSSVEPHQTGPWLIGASLPFIGTAPSAPCFT